MNLHAPYHYGISKWEYLSELCIFCQPCRNPLARLCCEIGVGRLVRTCSSLKQASILWVPSKNSRDARSKIKVCNPYSISFFNHNPTLVWFVFKCGLRNIHEKERHVFNPKWIMSSCLIPYSKLTSQTQLVGGGPWHSFEESHALSIVISKSRKIRFLI